MRAGGRAGVRNALVDALGSARKDRALLGGGIANGDDGIKTLLREFRDGLGTVRGDVDADFSHGCYGEGTDTARVGAGAVNFIGFAAEMAEETFSHLAAHGIAGAEN